MALLVWTFAGNGARASGARRAVAAVAFTVIEAALGAFLVKLGLTAQSRSPLRAPYLALHLTNTLLLLAALTLTAHFLGRRAGFLRGKVRIAMPFVGIASLVVVLVVGVTGSLAALGDTLFPPSSLGAAFAQDFFRPASGWCAGAGRIPPSRFWPASSSSGCWCAPRSAVRTGTTARSPRWC